MTSSRQTDSGDIVTDFCRAWAIKPALTETLKAVQSHISRALGSLDSHFYMRLFETNSPQVIHDEATRQRAIVAMTEHWQDILCGEIRAPTLQRCVSVGHRHSEFGVTERQFLIGYERVVERVMREIVESDYPNKPAAIAAVLKITMAHAELSLKAYRERVTELAESMMTVADVEELHDKVRSLEEVAYVDPLSRVFTRAYFDVLLTKEMTAALRAGRALCLMMVDIDHFKTINDGHGHIVGDRALRTLGTLLTTIARQSDICTRFGGDEFAIILPDTGLEAAFTVAERLREAVAKTPIRVSADRETTMTLSIGIAQFTASDTAESFIASADRALYDAKSRGRNQTILKTEKTLISG